MVEPPGEAEDKAPFLGTVADDLGISCSSTRLLPDDRRPSIEAPHAPLTNDVSEMLQTCPPWRYGP